MQGNKIKDYKNQSTYEVELIEKHDKDLLYHNNSKQWEENENIVDQGEIKNNDQLNYDTIKKYDTHIRQSPVHRQLKVSVSVKTIHVYIISSSMWTNLLRAKIQLFRRDKNQIYKSAVISKNKKILSICKIEILKLKTIFNIIYTIFKMILKGPMSRHLLG